MATAEEIAWLAGLYEGEGTCFTTVQRRPTLKTDYAQTRLTIAMTDEDVIRKAASIFPGYGSIRFQNFPGGRKTVWYWTVGSKQQIIDIVESIWPYLMKRRQEQIVLAFDKFRDNAIVRGHTFYNPFRVTELS